MWVKKRFSLEGNEAVVPAFDLLIEDAAQLGVEQVVLGMAHRGRLNVLANVLINHLRIFLANLTEKIMQMAIILMETLNIT